MNLVVNKLDVKFVIAIFIGIFASIVTSAKTTSPVWYGFGMLVSAIVLISIVVLPKKYVVYPVLLLIVNMVEHSQTYDDELLYGTILSASPWQITIGPFGGSVLVVVFLCAGYLRLIKYKINDILYVCLLVYFMAIVPIISYAYGYFNEGTAQFMVDAKVGVMFCVSILFFYSYYRRYSENILMTSQMFIALAVGNFVLDAYYMINGISGTDISGYRNISIDSGKGLLTVLIFYLLSMLLRKRNMVFNVVLITFSIYLLVAYQTRWLLITLVLGLVLVLILHGVKNMMIAISSICVVSIFVLPVLVKIFPDAIEAMALRFGFIESLSVAPSLDKIDIVRAGSIYNSMNVLKDKMAFLTGLGYGSWFDDKYFPMESLSLGSFNIQSLEAGKYYRVHDFFFHFLFKYGIIGLVLYVVSFARPMIKIWNCRKTIMANSTNITVSTVLFGSAPMVISYMYWSGKGLLFSGLFVVALTVWGKYMDNNMVVGE